MSRINTNVTATIAVNTLNKNNTALNTSLERLSTGYRINSGKDDPAGLIASESLKSEQRATETAISNAQRADNIIGTAEGALSEISNLLVSLQGLVGNSANDAGLSQDEKDANQLQVDSILSTINRISNSASFEGVKLLNGTFDYTTSSINGATSAFTSLSVNSAKVSKNALSVTVGVVQSAQTGSLTFMGSSTGLNGAATISVAGNKGTTQLSFASSTKASAIAASINQFTDSTGVKAVLSGNAMKLLSTGYGSSQFISVSSNNFNAFSTKNADGSTANSSYGRDAKLTVNGTTATSDGLMVKAVVGDLLDVDFTLNSTANFVGATKTFGITGGGATFSLGAQVNTANTASLSLGTINTASIGKYVDETTDSNKVYTLNDLSSGKEAAVNTGDTTLAQSIVTQAISDVSNLRGRLGAFQANTLDSTVNSLNVALENVEASNSAITDTDFATETSNMTRNQILVQSAQSVLRQANSAPQSVLNLLQ